ncbi:hypothetical protein BRADI_4g06556v3 [Brachypodium distachyon]|uniref:Uncharacterized protein n=1 Tax=Brachypodium distachyon TaxID=15368 RepID=A0A2K2CKV8_BRADI|nr:hypothetical protein BRADI_4g06556v3 [Brachypodium distachyon]
MVIETSIIPLATACLKALKFVAGLRSTSAQVKTKCEDLAERVKIHQKILPRYLSAAAEDEGAAAALRGFEAALGGVLRVVESCRDRHVQSGVVGLALAAVSGFDHRDLAKLEAAEKKIDTCVEDLSHQHNYQMKHGLRFWMGKSRNHTSA